MQMREKIAILEVDKEDYHQKLQRSHQELKRTKTEMRELVNIKLTLKAKVSELEISQGKGEISDTEEVRDFDHDTASSELDKKLKVSEKKLKEMAVSFKDLQSDKQSLKTQLELSSEDKTQLSLESKELKRKLGTALQLYAAAENQYDHLQQTSVALTQTEEGDEPLQRTSVALTQTEGDELLQRTSVAHTSCETQTEEGDKLLQQTSVALTQTEDPGDELLQRTSSETQTEEGVLVSSEAQTDHISHSDDEVEANSHREKEVQVDTLSGMCDQYKKVSEEMSEEVSNLKKEMQRSNHTHKTNLKEAEMKIHQLLSIKERLTKKNADLSRKMHMDAGKKPEESKEPEFQRTLSSALHSIQELELSICGDSPSQGQPDSEKLKNALEEMDRMKKAHSKEMEDMKKKVSGVLVKVKAREVDYRAEISELRTKLETSQKHLREVSGAATKSGPSGNAGEERIHETSIIQFKEIASITPCTPEEEGAWGESLEAVFRGKRVAARRIARDNLTRYSIPVIHKQISTVAHIRHPNLVLFIAVAMDAPGGMMILTEFLTCSLRQAYQTSLIRPDKLPVMLDIAMGLNFLHLQQKKPIVHNNLSSWSVLVEEVAGNRWRAKLSDIGATAPLVMISEPEKRHAVYLAPEIGSSLEALSTAVDVYSFGVVLCELAVNTLPESAEAMTEVIATSGLRNRLPQILFLIQSCLATEIEKRLSMVNMVKKIQHLVVNHIQMP